MKIVFKVTKINDNENNVEVLFANSDTSYGSTSLDTILESMNNLMTDDQRTVVKLLALYAGNYHFNDLSHEHFYILVRLKNGIPNRIIQVDADDYYKLRNCADLLNQEQVEKSITYEAFKVNGEIK